MPLRFGRPDVSTLTLPTGDTLTVRRRLNMGEARARFTRMSEPDDQGGRRVNPMQVGLATITAYLLDWTVTDADTGVRIDIRGLPLPELEALLDNLDPDDFRLVRDAIDAHEAAMRDERAADLKKNRDGILADLRVARRCGWRYEWVAALDEDVYAVLVEELLREQAQS